MTLAVAFLMVISSCASKKDLVNCQNENRELTNNYLTAKEQLAGSQARITSLEEQLASQKSLLEEQKRAYTRLQRTLDKSVANASQNNISIDKLVDQINESNQYIRHLVEVKSKSDSLNMVLTNNLTRSLSKECECCNAFGNSKTGFGHIQCSISSVGNLSNNTLSRIKSRISICADILTECRTQLNSNLTVCQLLVGNLSSILRIQGYSTCRTVMAWIRSV